MTLSVLMGCLCVYSIVYAQSRLNSIPDAIYKTEPRSGKIEATDVVSDKTANVLPSLQVSSLHPIRASHQISEEALRGFLELHSSPLDPYASQILDSPFYSSIIAITNAEESFYKNPPCIVNGKAVGLTNNLYGMMRSGGTKAGLMCFDTLRDGWNYMNDWFAAREVKQPNIEDYRARYCWAGYNESHICPEWEPQVLKIKVEVESLN